MTSQPLSNGVAGHMGNSSASHACTLLKQAARLYVSEPCHSNHEAVMFEELCTQLLRVADLPDRIEVATTLAAYDQVPRSVMRMLLHDICPVASVMIEQAVAIDDLDLLSLIGSAPSGHVELVAARAKLSPTVIEALLNKMPPESLPVLLANKSIHLPPPAIPYVVDLGRDHPAIASALAERFDDVQDVDLIGLFMSLDSRGRRRVIQALEIAALREFAARRPAPRVPMPEPATISALARACLARESDVMAGHLGQLLNLPETFALRLLSDRGGEPLAIALRAAGIDASTATRVILFSGVTDTRSYFDVKRLVELFETVSLRSSVLLVDAWRGKPHDIPARANHVPQTQTGSPVRGPQDSRQPAPAQSEAPAIRRGNA